MLPSDFDIFSASSSTIPLCIQIRASGTPRAASDWAISFSWWGKTRSSRRRGSRIEAPARPRPSPSTRCASRAVPCPRASPRTCPRPPCAPSRARSRAGPPSATRCPPPRPGPCPRCCGSRASRSRRSCGPGSRRRRPTRRRARTRSAPRSARRSPRSSPWPAARRPGARARAGRCPRSRPAVISSANSSDGLALPRCAAS